MLVCADEKKKTWSKDAAFVKLYFRTCSAKMRRLTSSGYLNAGIKPLAMKEPNYISRASYKRAWRINIQTNGK